MRLIFITALSLALSAPAALADTTSSLAPGKPAGVRQAQWDWDNGNGMLLVAGLALVGTAITLAVVNNGSSAVNTSGGSSSSTSTTGTSP